MKIRRTMTISLPEAMAQQVEKVRKAEHRTRSELVREALRTYFTVRAPEAAASPRELAAIRRGRSEILRGDYLTIDELRQALETPRRKASRKRT
jgi:Arc/MetJ-type ribon-helix-helix transcriptional regulator